jgi:hypothetical protein
MTFTASTYSPSDENEDQRLALQAKLNTGLDQEMFEFALNKLPSRPVGIDIGCAHGAVTKDRFRNFGDFSKIYGLDQDADVIGSVFPELPNWKKIVVSAESEDFSKVIRQIVKENNNQPALVFMAYFLMHLDDPVQVLKRLKEELPAGSQIVIRTTDDSFSVADFDGFEQILNPSVPVARGGDRHHGRKVYEQLKKAGYQQIKIFTENNLAQDVPEAERQNFYDICYSWRLESLKEKVDSGQATEEQIQEYDYLKLKLDQLKQAIIQDDIFLGFTAIGAVAEV